MLGRKQEFNLKLTEILDAILLALAGGLSYTLRDRLTPVMGWEAIPSFESFFWIMAIVAPFTPLVLEMLGFYKHPLQKSFWRSIQQLFHAAFWLGLFIGAGAIFLRLEVGARSFLPLFAALGAAFLLTREAVLRSWLKRKARRGEMRERILFAGPPEDVEKLLAGFPRETLLEMEIVERFDLSSRTVDDLVTVLHDKNVERVLFASAHVHFGKLEEAIAACEIEGVEAWLWTGFIQTSVARPTFDAMGGKPMLVFRSTPDVEWALAFKWLMDKAGAITGILLCLPLWLVCWLGIKLSSPGAPAIFKQRRSGKYGRPFTMLKFRTMCPDAEAKRRELEAQNQMSGPVFKVERDPRIFRFGAFLRKFSLDETPQFFNILRGDMSLVGPRPLPTYEVANISKAAQRRRLSVKPGITCLWQISGRNEITDFDDWAKLDLKYIDTWSIWLDIKILFMTLPAVFFGRGAK
jgi:exopolysaccharide biosynthesis polyprenyl glycosylphosphotransferase